MINVKKVKPLFNYLITTKDVYTEQDTDSGVLITNLAGSLKEYQTVVAVGPLVRDIKEGDIVCINPRNYAIKKYKDGSLNDGVIQENSVVSYNFHIVELDHIPHLLLRDSDIDFVIEDYAEESPTIVIPEKKIII